MELQLILLTVTGALSLTALILTIVLLSRVKRLDLDKLTQDVRGELADELEERLTRESGEITAQLRGIGESNLHAVNALGQSVLLGQNQAGERQTERIRAFEEKTGTMLRGQSELVDSLKHSVTEQMGSFRGEMRQQSEQLDKTLSGDQKQLRGELTAQLETLQKNVCAQLAQMAESIRLLEKSNEERLERIRAAVDGGMKELREENGKKLDEIRGTVDEKLQTTLEKRISESFRTVSDQLEQVYKGIGEMQSIAGEVGGLKKVLSGVKTRGILGEVQLGAILQEILSPEQYEENVATIPNSKERVEFAVRLPAKDGGCVYLPIDSKFPGDRFQQLLEAQESGDREQTEAAYRLLESVIKTEAKDIRDKYVEVPYTTNFGIMFLPFEGLYAEVVNRGLIEVLQRDYHISVAGPSTMAALLNSLQMGFRTLAIQKRSNEVWEVLGAVKTEFDKFGEAMRRMQSHLNSTSSDLEALIGTRTRAIDRKLRSIQRLDEGRAAELLELGDGVFPEDET